MTNAELIQKIRSEIERLAKRADRRTNKDHASHNAEMERYGEDYWNGYGDLAYALLSFLDSLESKKPVPADLEEAAEKASSDAYPYKDEFREYDKDKVDETREYFKEGFLTGAKWKENKTDQLPNELEEAAEGLEKEMDRFFETMPVLEHENIFEDTFKNLARHFAKWGAEHLKK